VGPLIAATSAVPFLAVSGVLVLVVAIVQTRSLLRSSRRSSVVSLSSISEKLEVVCGFRIRTPSILSVSYPLGRLIISTDVLVLHGPIGDYVFERSGVVTVRPLRRTLLFRRVRVEGADMSAVVFIRDPEALQLALDTHEWMTAGSA
jgi:hypothetical protein